MTDILTESIKEYRQQFLQGLAQDFAALREDSEAWEEEIQERQAWSATLSDDLVERQVEERLRLLMRL